MPDRTGIFFIIFFIFLFFYLFFFFFWGGGGSVNLSIFLGLGVEAGASPMYPQKITVPPPPPPHQGFEVTSFSFENK